MNWLQWGVNLVTIVSSVPWENFIKPNHGKSEKLSEELRVIATTAPPSVAGIPAIETPTTVAVLEKPSSGPSSEHSLEETIRREQEGDYCLACTESKHWDRALDALSDARNIIASTGICSEVAEGKVQQAVLELNAAEVDLEKAVVSDKLQPVVSEMHTQNRKLRNFLRADHSGLEICTLQTDKDVMLQNLDNTIESLKRMIKAGYETTKLQILERVKQIKEAKEAELSSLKEAE